MDTISTAVINTLTNNMAAGADQRQVDEAFNALKVTFGDKFPSDHDLMVALDMLEKKPISAGRQETFKEEVVLNQAHLDPELQAAAQVLLNRLSGDSDKADTDEGPEQIVPLLRPRRQEHFLGRDAEITPLLDSLQPGKVVCLCGPGGIGKSTLVIQALWQLAPHNTPPNKFPGGIVYHDFFTQPRVDIALEEIVRTYGVEPLPSSYEAAERLLANKKALFVFDNADQADDLNGLLEITGSCGVLFTSRQCPESPTEQFTVSALGAEQAMELLRVWAGPLDNAVAARLCELLGYLPLTVRLTGHYLADNKNNPTEYLDWLETTLLPDMSQDARQQAGVSLVLEKSLAQTSEVAQQALAIASLLAPVPFDQKIIEKTLYVEQDSGLLTSIKGLFGQKPEKPIYQIRTAMRQLSSYGLLWWIGGRYQITHPLVYTYSKQSLTPPPQALKRLATYYMLLAWEQNTANMVGNISLGSERPHYMKVLTNCVEMQDWESAHGLAAAVEDYLDRNGFWADRVIANEVGLIASWQLGRPSEGAWLGNLGDTYRTMGHAKWAIEHFQQALNTARQSHDRHGEANSLGNLGLAYRDLGQIEQAQQYLQEAHAILVEIRAPSANLVKDWLLELEAWQADQTASDKRGE